MLVLSSLIEHHHCNSEQRQRNANKEKHVNMNGEERYLIKRCGIFLPAQHNLAHRIYAVSKRIKSGDSSHPVRHGGKWEKRAREKKHWKYNKLHHYAKPLGTIHQRGNQQSKTGNGKGEQHHHQKEKDHEIPRKVNAKEWCNDQ